MVLHVTIALVKGYNGRYLFPRVMRQADMLACPFDEYREGEILYDMEGAYERLDGLVSAYERQMPGL